MLTMLNLELKKRIINDIIIYFFGKNYSFEEIFRNSGDYDEYRSDDGVQDYIDLACDYARSSGVNGLRELLNAETEKEANK